MSSDDRKHRSHLPIPSPDRTGLITYDAGDPDTKFPPIEQLRPPKGAPNVPIDGLAAQLAIGSAAESSDHLASAEDAIRIAMARQ